MIFCFIILMILYVLSFVIFFKLNGNFKIRKLVYTSLVICQNSTIAKTFIKAIASIFILGFAFY